MIDLDKIRSRGGSFEKSVKHFFHDVPKNSNYFVTKIKSLLNKHDYSNYTNFKLDESDGITVTRSSTELQLGVYELINGVWVWSWINSVETNYTAIHDIVTYFNTTEEGILKPVTHISLLNDFKGECNRVLMFIYNNTEFVFGLNGVTELSKKLQITTSRTWYDSKFSELTFVRTIEKEGSDVFLPKNRGNADDYLYGIDLKIDGMRYQHKKAQVIDWENSCMVYGKLKKSKHESVDRLVVEYGVSIYEFDISDIYGEGVIESFDGFEISHDRLIEVHDNQRDEIVDTCEKIFRLCIDNGYVFEMFESKPYIELNEETKVLLIGFENSKIHVLENELNETLNHLMVLTNSEAKLSEYSPSPIT
jgi:hypothetical protein